MNILFSDEANEDITRIANNIVDFAGYQSAVNVLSDIRKIIELLEHSPYMGIVGHVNNTYELYPRGYRVVYEINNCDEIIILTIVHCKRLYP